MVFHARMRRAWVWGIVAIAAVAGCDCDQGGETGGGDHKVAVSIFPLYDIAQRVAGERIEVVLVLPPGQSEHQYDPTPREMAALAGSDLGIAVGLELDGWVERIIENAAGDDVEVVQLGPDLDPRPMAAPTVGEEEGEHHDEGEEHEGEEAHHHHHHHGANDPHFWLDPVRMKDAVDLIVAAFSELDPEGADGFRARGDEVKASLDALHREIGERADGWTRRSIVTMHGSFGYYADRYDLTIAAIVEPFPGREPTPRYMAEVLEAVQATDAAALFSEPQLDPRPARVIAEQASIPLGELDPVGGSEGVDTYESLMTSNTEVLDRLLR